MLRSVVVFYGWEPVLWFGVSVVDCLWLYGAGKR